MYDIHEAVTIKLQPADLSNTKIYRMYRMYTSQEVASYLSSLYLFYEHYQTTSQYTTFLLILDNPPSVTLFNKI